MVRFFTPQRLALVLSLFVREGKLRMAVVADHVAPSTVEVASAEAVEAVISNIRLSAKTEKDRLDMFHLATEVRRHTLN